MVRDKALLRPRYTGMSCHSENTPTKQAAKQRAHDGHDLEKLFVRQYRYLIIHTLIATSKQIISFQLNLSLTVPLGNPQLQR